MRAGGPGGPGGPDRPGPLRVAAAQGVSVSGDVAANVATSVSLVQAAADGGARLVVLPELFLTGYDAAAWTSQGCLTLDDPMLSPLAAAARKASVSIVVGAAVARGDGDGVGRHTVSVLVFGSDGVVAAPYDKQHLFSDERAFFDAGDHGASILLDGWELGLGICYDGCFPEHAAAASAGGATAYLCPAAYFVGAEHRRDLYYAARALDNGIYVILAGLAGRCGSWEFSGGSAIYDPQGRTVDRVGDAAPAIAFADLDPDEVSRVQNRHPLARDRLADLGGRQRLTLP